MDSKRKLCRSDKDKVLCGACGGMGEYFDIDSTIVRLVWAILVCSGPEILACIIVAIVIPKEEYR